MQQWAGNTVQKPSASLRSPDRIFPRRPTPYSAARETGGARLRARATMLDERKQLVSSSIRVVPDFPKPGIMFQDVTTLLMNPPAFKACIDDFAERYVDQDVDIIAGFEARGFVFGAPLALQLGKPFVCLRKPGKLPGETISAEYQLEYGSDKIEMSTLSVKPGQRVLLIDDLIATGGTLAAGISLIKKVGGEVVEACCVIELPELNGKAKLSGTPLYIQIQVAGE